MQAQKKSGGQTVLNQGAKSRTVGLSILVTAYITMIALPVQAHLGPIYMSGVRLVLIVAFVPLFIDLIRRRGLNFGDVALIIFSLWSLLAIWINSPEYLMGFGASYVIETLGAYLLARVCIRSAEHFVAMAKLLFMTLIFTLPFALYETQTGFAPITQFISKIPGLDSYADFFNAAAGRRLGLERSQVIFSHPIHYGVFCASLFSIALVSITSAVSMTTRYLLAGLSCVGVVASVSSGAILPVFFQVGLFVWSVLWKESRMRWRILAIVSTICYFTVDIISNRTAIEVLLEYVTLSADTAYGRIIIFEWGMFNVWNNPVFGLGLNDWVRPWYKISPSMDNFWLLTAVRYGIPGFLLLCVGYLWILMRVLNAEILPGTRPFYIRRGWVFVQVALIISLCTVDVWSSMLSYIFFLLGCGVWLFEQAGNEAVSSTHPRRVVSERHRSVATRFAHTTRSGVSPRKNS